MEAEPPIPGQPGLHSETLKSEREGRREEGGDKKKREKEGRGREEIWGWRKVEKTFETPACQSIAIHNL